MPIFAQLNAETNPKEVIVEALIVIRLSMNILKNIFSTE